MSASGLQNPAYSGGLSVSGSTPQAVYAISSQVGKSPRGLWQYHSAEVQTGPLTATLGRQRSSDFAPGFSDRVQALELALRPGRLQLALGLRGIQGPEELMSPTGADLRAGWAFANGLSLLAGAIIDVAGGLGPALPVVTGAFEQPGVSVQVSVAGPSTAGPITAIGASTSLQRGLCSLKAAAGARLGGALEMGLAFDPYLPRSVWSLAATGRCQVGKLSAMLSAVRQDLPWSVPSTMSGLLVGANLRWDHKVQVRAQWNPWNSSDYRNQVNLSGSGRMAGKWTFGASVHMAGLALSFDESGYLERQFGVLQGRVDVGLTHRFALLGGVARAGLQASATKSGLTGTVGIRAFVPLASAIPMPMLLAAVRFVPVPSWALGLTGTWMPDSGSVFVGASAAYSFGDSLPPERMLDPLRSRGILAVVYHDENGDGRRDAGEQGIPGAELCVDEGVCTPTGTDGAWTAEGLALGEHQLVSRATSLKGAIATTPARQTVAVGGFSPAMAQFGIQYRGRLVIRLCADTNGDGACAANEPVLRGQAVRVVGPELDTNVELNGAGRSEVLWSRPGRYEIEVNHSRVPAGYFANGLAHKTVELAEFGTASVEVGVSVARSIFGRVCLDANENGLCEPAEQGIGLIHVKADGREVPTDTDGNFLFQMMPAGTFELLVPEIELPGGLVLRRTRVVDLPEKPTARTSVFLPLVREKKQLKRTYAVLVDWPGVGAASALEIAGYLADATALRTPPKKKGEKPAPPAPVVADRAGILAAAKAARGRDVRLFVSVSADPRLPGAQAEEDAQDIASNFAAWLVKNAKVPEDNIVLEMVPPSGPVPRLNVRALQRRK